MVTKAAHPDANIIFGAVVDDTLGDEVRVTVIAAGFDRWGQRDAEEIVRPDEEIFSMSWARTTPCSEERSPRSSARPSGSCSTPTKTSTFPRS